MPGYLSLTSSRIISFYLMKYGKSFQFYFSGYLGLSITVDVIVGFGKEAWPLN